MMLSSHRCLQLHFELLNPITLPSNQVAAVSCSGVIPRQAFIYDVTSQAILSTLLEPTGGAGAGGGAGGPLLEGPSPLRAGGRSSGRSVLSAAWSPTDDLIMWGSTLWDLRVPKVRGEVRGAIELGSCPRINGIHAMPRISCALSGGSHIPFPCLAPSEPSYQLDQPSLCTMPPPGHPPI